MNEDSARVLARVERERNMRMEKASGLPASGVPARDRVSADNAVLLTSADVARYLSVEPAWVYANALELGAIRLGTGRKPRLRFRRELVDAYLEQTQRGRLSPQGGTPHGLPGQTTRRVNASCSAGRQSDAALTHMVKPKQRRGRIHSWGTDVELLPIRGRK